MAKYIVYAMAVIAVGLCGCSTSAVDDGSYPMGVMLPAKGVGAEASAEVVRGMELARDEINASGGLDGIPLKLLVRDSSAFLESFESLRRAGARVISVGFGRECIAQKTFLSKRDDVFVNFMCTYPPATLDMPNATRIFLNGAQAGDIMAKAVERGEDRDVRLVVMNVDDFFGKADADYLSFDLKLDRTKLYRDVFGAEERDFDIFATQIIRLDADCVFYVGYGDSLGAFAEALARAGYGKKIVANCGIAASKISVPKGVGLYAVETDFARGALAGEKTRAFVSAYKAKYGVEPTWLAAYGYDSVRMLADAAKRSRFNPTKMRDCFRNTSYDGAVGKIEFDNSADSLSQISLVRK